MATPVNQPGRASAMSRMPAPVSVALTAVAWFGVTPMPWAMAATIRPAGRLTSREYAAVPREGFWAERNASRLDPYEPSGGLFTVVAGFSLGGAEEQL